ncbi:hypothetical protein IMZ11_38885 [Microtetraspora sp. AC03309]|uniref:hypothetical protein n=1 Tax=Microtetraspora sp. AC03309 TaxID=2779376 RepID=UPI001E29DA4F|nr:hypothetical protein [Microtetraspora sp. AC03309]MCC5581585.1 hypothetical protein [Microtetraspora sp. AC03309]
MPLYAHRIPLLVTTDVPADTDLVDVGRILADAVCTLRCGNLTYPALLQGATFWLDAPVRGHAPLEELRFTAMLGHLSATAPHESARDVVSDARAAITAAVSAHYGHLGSCPPAVLAVRSDDVAERTPASAVPVTVTAETPVLVTALG